MQSIKKYIFGLLALVFASSLALAGQYSQVPLLTGAQDPSQLTATVNSVIVASNAVSPGLLFSNGTSTPNSGTAEATLYTYTLPGGYLSQNGQSIRVRCYVGTANNANNKTLLLYFGASSVTTAAAANTVGGWLEYTVTRTGAATQTLAATGIFGATGVTPIAVQFTAATETLSGDIIIRCRATDAVSTDTTGRLFTVETVR